MKITLSFLSKKSWYFLLVLLFLISETSIAQTDNGAAADITILPWLGIWKAIDESPASGTTFIEILPGAVAGGLDITTKDAAQPVSENIIPDGVSRTFESNTCKGTRKYQWEKQAGVLLGTSEMVCQGEVYNVFTIKMMTAADRMTDILFIKTPDQSSLAVRHFAFEKDLPSAGDFFQAQESMVLRTALSAPWDLDIIISLSRTVETVAMEAAILEKNLQVKLDSKSLRTMKSAGTPDSIIDLLVAMSAPDKFRIEKNAKIAVEAAHPSNPRNSEFYSYTYRMEPYYYYGYYYPWNYYWGYNSPFWWGYPFYTYPGFIAGGGGSSGGGGGTGGRVPAGSTGGRLSSGSGYVEITPRDTGRQAVPRGSGIPGTGNAVPSGRAVPSDTGAAAVSSGVGSYSTGSTSSSSGGGSVSSGNSASPSGYSGRGNSGTAVPR